MFYIRYKYYDIINGHYYRGKFVSIIKVYYFILLLMYVANSGGGCHGRNRQAQQIHGGDFYLSGE